MLLTRSLSFSNTDLVTFPVNNFFSKEREILTQEVTR